MTEGKAREYAERLINASYYLCPHDLVGMASKWDDIADDIRIIGVECFKKEYLKGLEVETLEVLNRYE